MKKDKKKSKNKVSNTLFSIPTQYKNVEFRSRLEAKWAEYFDLINMNWAYEVEGYELSNCEWYLPDFWLPDCKTFFEVKGPLAGKDDFEKIYQLARDVAYKNIMVIMGGVHIPRSMTLGKIILKSMALVYPFPAYYDDEEIDVRGKKAACGLDSEDSNLEYDKFRIGTCRKCKKPYFFHLNGAYSCRNCGYYDGDNSMDIFYDPEW